MSAKNLVIRGNELGPAEEYQSLREEMLQAKKYVFERPLFIIALSLATSRLLEKELAVLLLVLMAALLLFNFWFTVNRLFSAARIAAYIQLELEERSHGRWVGWESCLREYRRWLKNDPDKNREEFDIVLDADAVPDIYPDFLGHYPPIYGLHIGLMILALGGAIFFAERDRNWISGTGALLVFSLVIWFSVYVFQYRPKVMKALVERNRVIWRLVFTRMQKVGLK